MRELGNCSSGGDFRVSRHAEICQIDRFSLEINFKRARSCNYGIPRLVQVKMKILYICILILNEPASSQDVLNGTWKLKQLT